MIDTPKYRKNSVKQSTEVRYSDRGFTYAERGNSEIIGIIPFLTEDEKPDLTSVPQGIIIYNTTSGQLEISDPLNTQWIAISGVGVAVTSGVVSGNNTLLGLPTDGTYTDGPVTINPSGTVADAIDQINEYLASIGTVFSSHLGTTDGTTNGLLQDPNFVVGRVSSPSSPGSPYYTNNWDDDTNRDLVNFSSFLWELTPTEKITDLQGGTIVVEYTDGNGDSLGTETINLNGSLANQSSTPMGYVSVTSLQTFGSKIEGFLSINLPVNVLFGGGPGYFKVHVDHTTIDLNVYSQEVEFFKDAGNNPSILSENVSLNSSPIKYLSGIQFATISGVTYPNLQIAMSGNDIWQDTYRADPLLVVSSDLGIADYAVNYNANSVTKNGFSPPMSPFIYNEDFIYSEAKDITDTNFTNPNSAGSFAQIRFAVRDPFTQVNGSLFYPSPNILINTYSNQSNDTTEYFLDEDYRLDLSAQSVGALSAINGSGRGAYAWDSTQDLTGTTGLQVINGRLIYPQSDFSAFVPATNPDYTSLLSTGDLIYLRRFKDSTGASRSNGVFRLQGLSESDRAAGNILVDIRVVGTHMAGNGIQMPGNEGTGWLSLNTGYNSGTFVGDDGDGCFVTINGYIAPDFEFTLGGFSTAFADNMAIEVRVTFKDPAALSKVITLMQIIDWN